jgi:hypothetical protein
MCGDIRYLRPEFQCPEATSATQAELAVADGGQKTEVRGQKTEGRGKKTPDKKQPWPKALPDQVRVLQSALAASPLPVTAEELARMFSRARTDRVADLLETLAALGQAQQVEGGRYSAG